MLNKKQNLKSGKKNKDKETGLERKEERKPTKMRKD